MPMTNSPMSSPSLRAIAHAHARTSYFPPVPNATHYPPRTPANSMNVHTHAQGSPTMRGGSPLIGCLKHTNRPIVSSPVAEVPTASYYTSSTPSAQPVPAGGYAQSAMRSTNPSEKRRASMGNFKVSQIPLSPGGARNAHTLAKTPVHPVKTVHSNTLDTTSRRRPSFKIELPPRPIQTSSYTTSAPLVDSPLVHRAPVPMPTPGQYPSRLAGTPPVFRDPFPAQAQTPHAGGYIILRAPSHHAPTTAPGLNNAPSPFFDNFPSPTQPAEEIWPGMVGLGYSLNRLRAPTPWLRGHKDTDSDLEDNEWLRTNDLDTGAREVENRMRGLGVA